MWSKSMRLAGLVLAAAALAGCATSFVVDSNVQSFSSLAALPAQPTYRFDRLPSQQAFQFQGQIEAMADPALFKAGLRRDDAAPQLGVQVTARVQRVLSPWAWADPWDEWGGLPGWHPWHGAFGPFPRAEQPWYHREVGIVVRELPTGRVVYETHAVSDGPWSDNAAVFPAMFDAALQGFPSAPAGVRQVNVTVGPPAAAR
ncbi:DUF4136 domain-containing protein [Caenimonas terrae]|uniref:DUF4136 domain-containing protein n=1 Tax=Caenimonas terrae TaxID=696074 RepID=A0ABW0NK25_9BURK